MQLIKKENETLIYTILLTISLIISIAIPVLLGMLLNAWWFLTEIFFGIIQLVFVLLIKLINTKFN